MGFNVGDQIRNRACHAYLQKLLGPITTIISHNLNEKQKWSWQALKDILLPLQTLYEDNERYRENIAYGDAYTAFINGLMQWVKDGQLDTLTPAFSKETLTLVDNLLIAVYCNDNRSLETTYQAIRSQIQLSNQVGNSSVNHHLTNTGKNKVNQLTPQGMGRIIARATTNIDPSYQPMSDTSLPVVRRYAYEANQNPSLPIEIRLGTQAMVEGSKYTINPLFQAYLYALKRKGKQNKGIDHVYFNYLTFEENERSNIAPIQLDEVALTEQLVKLENKHDNFLLISLPSDRGLFAKNKLCKKQIKKEEVQQIIMAEVGKITFSRRACGLLYTTKNKKTVFDELIKKSLETFSLNDNASLTSRQMQAVFFHLIHFELTDFILAKTNAKYCNRTCKDGIDRGAAASAYYHLIKSIELGQPLSQDEFEQAIHAAAALVKGRSMNSNILRLWNAIDSYVDANEKSILENEQLSWLYHWRNENTPERSAKAVFNKTKKREAIELDKIVETLSSSHEKILLSQAKNIFCKLDSTKTFDTTFYQAVLQFPRFIQKVKEKTLSQEHIERIRCFITPCLAASGSLQQATETGKKALQSLSFLPKDSPATVTHRDNERDIRAIFAFVKKVLTQIAIPVTTEKAPALILTTDENYKLALKLNDAINTNIFS